MMREHHFQDEWFALSAKDPRITIYQEPGFCLSWFAATAPVEQPVLLTQRHEASGALIGLMVLTWYPHTQKIQHAGAHQAIYDGWVALPEHSNSFVSDCIEIVFEQFELREWIWRYLPRILQRSGLFETDLNALRASQLSPYPLPRWNLADDKFSNARRTANASVTTKSLPQRRNA